MVTALRNEGFRIQKVDLRSGSSLIEKYDIRRNPTYVYIVNGKEVRRGAGKYSIGTVRNMFRLSF